VNKAGATFKGERRTKTFKYRYRDYDLDFNDPESIRAAMDRERIGHSRVLMTAEVEFEDENGNQAFRSTHFFDAMNDDEADSLSEAISRLENEYSSEGLALIGYTLSFTFAQGT